MASIILSSVGSSVGNMLLPGLGGRLLSSVARRGGKLIDQAIGWTSSSEVKDGPRLESFEVQDSRYGVAIPTVFGRARVAGNVIWVSDLIETAHETEVSGGKGGVVSSAFSTTRTTYTYSLNCAIALCAGEIGSIETIWVDSKVVYQNGVWTSGVVESAAFHYGTADQAVDPLLESWIGSGLVPAYRGTAYVVLQGLQISKFGNRLPNLTFELAPKTATGKPQWLGMDDPDLYHAIVTNRNSGMKPLIIEGGDLSARRMIVGGYALSGSVAKLEVAEYDVTSEAPVELARTQSGALTGEDVGDHAWAMAADGRFVAVGLQDGGTTRPYYVAIYDSQTRQFGEILSVPMPVMETRQIAWIDAQRFVIMDISGDARGVRVFMRSGLSVCDLGFYAVWGAGSRTSRVPETYAQFLPYAGGLLHCVVDSAPRFSLMEARHLVWQNNALRVGEKYTLASVATGTGNTPQAFFLKTGDGEWTLFYASTIDMRMMSFRPGKESAEITRPWQILKNGVFSVCLCHAPIVIGNKIVVVQRSSVENAYRLSEITLGEESFSLTVDGAALTDFQQVGLNFGCAIVDSSRLLISANWGYAGDLGRLDMIRRRNTGDTLDRVVAAILERSGYASGDYDVTALADIEVDGYVLSEQATGAAAIEPLQLLAPFDFVESDRQLKAVKRGADDAIEIDAEESGATPEGEAELAPLYAQMRRQEIDLPVEVSVDYQDATRDYEVGSQRARRGVSKGSRHVVKLSLPLVVSPTKAKRIAEERLFDVWSERSSGRVFLSNAWMGLSPGDVVRFEGEKLRVDQVRLEKGVVRVDVVACPASPFASLASAESGSGGSGVFIASGVATSLYLMDVPLLRAEDDQPGFYAAASGLDGWTGAGLFRAGDGVTFAQVASFDSAAVAGSAVTALPPHSPYYRDRQSVLYVQLLRGALSSCTEADLLNGANAALVGGEVLQFQTAVLAGPGLYALSDLLRGRNGTEEGCATHAPGESFVLLSPSTLKFLPLALSDRNVSYHFRAVSNGGSLDLAQDFVVAPQMKVLEPLAPVHVRGVRAGGDLTLSWKRRVRKNGAWVDYIDAPLDESAEAYDVEIMDDSAVRRTFADVPEASVIYTASQQVADWGGTIPATFTVRVYQKSSRYGRGKKAEAIV